MVRKEIFISGKNLLSGSMVVLLAISLLLPNIIHASLKEEMEQYFVDLEKYFEEVADVKVLQKMEMAAVDGHFMKALIPQQPITSFIRTNSKGIVINEMIRARDPLRNYQKVHKEKWYSHAKRNLKTYHSSKMDENGRYKLLWSKPIMLASADGKEKFGGVVFATIDLWDCFYEISKKTETPFLIRLGKKTLYVNKWENVSNVKKENLSIPGISKIWMRYQEGPVTLEKEPEVAQADTMADTTSAETIGQSAETLAGTQGKEKSKGSGMKIFFGIIFIMAIVGLYIAKVHPWLREKGIFGKRESEEDMFN